MRLGWERLGQRLLLGNRLGCDHRLGTDGRDGRRDFVGRVVLAVVVRVLVIVVMLIIVMMIIVMGMMLVVAMIVMIMRFELAVMLGIGVQMLALMDDALGIRRQRLALDRLGCGIGTCLEALDDVALDALAMAATAGIAVAGAAAAVGAVLGLFLGLAMGLLLGLDQRLPVGDRDLVVVGMDFAEGEEAVAVAAIFDEGGLERGFDPGDLGEVDIAAQLLALRGLEIKLFDAIAADHDDPGLFRVGGIDQHLVGHVLTLGGGGR
jgi:hypothetical protein